MLRRFGWFYKVLGFGRRLSCVQFEENSVDRIRDAAERGPLVYVLADASAADHLALNTVLNRRRLPLSVWSNGANSFWWQPVVEAWRDLWLRLTGPHEDPVATGWLAAQIRNGQVVTLFLRGRRLWSGGEGDPFEALMQAQRTLDRPIQIVPIVVNWTRAPQLSNPTLSFLLGRGPQGPLGQLRNIWFRAEGTFVQAGEPLDLQEFARRARSDSAVRALRTVLRRYLKRESILTRGPMLLPYHEMKQVVLDNPALKQLAVTQAREQGMSVEAVRRDMEKEYHLIASNFRWWVVRWSDVLLNIVWTRVFSGVDVRPEDIEAIRDAMRRGTAVLMPCHKSHADYVLISWVLYSHNLIVPHVIAGANLAIWPLSIFFRSVGGFFIKRSFSGEVLHPAIFSWYLRELVFRGYPVEFYVEGGRSRSGKLLPPRVGVLGMVFEAAERRPHDHEVTLLPISLAYEEVAEEGAYVREASGEDKRPESMGQVIKARSVLKRRFGRVYLRVGEPIKCSEHVDARDGEPMWTERSEASRKSELHDVGQRVIDRIGQVTVVLPTCLVAAALLAHHRRGIRQPELLERILRFRSLLASRGALEAASLARHDQAIRTALDRFTRAGHIEALQHGGERIWSVEPAARISLEFYKNQLLHYLSPAGFVALVIRGQPEGELTEAQLLPGVQALLKLWPSEFVFATETSAEVLVQSGVATLVQHGALTATDTGGWVVAEVDRMGEIYQLFRNFAEAWLLVLRHPIPGATRKTLPKELSAISEKLLGIGAITRPESVSTITLGNAASAYVRMGVFTEDDRGSLQLVPDRAAPWLDLLVPMVD